MTGRAVEITTPDGRVLDTAVTGPERAPLVFWMHGTPGSPLIRPAMADAAVALGLRVVALARPGYAGSSRLAGRDVASVVADVITVADELGAPEFAVAGASGGGPHALACGALAAARCRAVATIASAAPFGQPDLDFLAGMGEGNEIEFAAATSGEQALRALLPPWRKDMIEAGPKGTYDALLSVLSKPDREVFTGDVAAEMHAAVSVGLRDGVDGWVDDDLAFVRPWGFAPQDVTAPVHLWQGGQDLMVPPAHGLWLAERLPQCRLRLEPDEGHLTIGIRRMAEVLADLAAALQ